MRLIRRKKRAPEAPKSDRVDDIFKELQRAEMLRGKPAPKGNNETRAEHRP